MAHLVETMAYLNAEPWHGLGNQLPAQQPIEVWQQAAGMDWNINEAPVMYSVAADNGLHFRASPDNKVLFRSDSHAALSVVSNRYKVVQPKEILEFYRNLVSAGGFELETAGVLKGGRKLWALARTNQQSMLSGGDQVKAYLLLATSCDGTLCTQAFFTSVRVVCNNTLQLALDSSSGVVKVPHSTTFDPALVKQELGLGLSAWESFTRSIKKLAARPVSETEAKAYLASVLGDVDQPFEDQPRPVKTVYELFAGRGIGAGMASSKGTAWGLLNAVTEHVDHGRPARSQDNRLDSAWFGNGAVIKAKAFERSLALAA